MQKKIMRQTKPANPTSAENQPPNAKTQTGGITVIARGTQDAKGGSKCKPIH